VGSSSVTLSSRRRLPTFSAKPRYFVEERDELGQGRAFDFGRAFSVAHGDAVGGALDHDFNELTVVLDELERLALLDGVKGRLGDEDVAAFNQFRHVPEEKREEQGADVGAVDVGVGHQDDLAVAHFGRIEVVLRNARAEGGDHAADFFVRQHFVVAGFFHV